MQGQIKAADNSVLIEVLDEISPWGISASSFSQALAAAEGRPVTVAINSPGGLAWDGSRFSTC